MISYLILLFLAHSIATVVSGWMYTVSLGQEFTPTALSAQSDTYLGIYKEVRLGQLKIIEAYNLLSGKCNVVNESQ